MRDAFHAFSIDKLTTQNSVPRKDECKPTFAKLNPSRCDVDCY